MLTGELGTGLTLLHEHSNKLDDSVRALNETRQRRGQRILENLVSEEAAKYLILLDAARCGKKRTDAFSRHLKAFIDHIARGVYASLAGTWHQTYKSFRLYVEKSLKTLYLDGPNGVDWIFRNEIESTREEALYVDYVETEDGRGWHTPAQYEKILGNEDYDTPHTPPRIMQIVNALHVIGIGDPRAIEVLADVWRSVEVDDSFSDAELQTLNEKVLETLSERHLLLDDTAPIRDEVIKGWFFPLYPIDLVTKASREVNVNDLKAARECSDLEY